MLGEGIKRPIRSLLLRAPWLYARANSQWRYRALHRLRIVHERDFRALPSLTDRPDPVVLDVGGNVGQSVLSILTVLPAARITTFEPNPENRAPLERLARRFPNVEVATFALGDRAGRHELHTPIYRGLPIGALSSLDEEAAMSWLGPERIGRFDTEALELRRFEIDVRRLDDLGLEPEVVKIDVQGLEDAVIVGGAETIARSRPVIMAESLGPEGPGARALDALGYEAMHYRAGRLVPASGTALNVFLVPPERRARGSHG